MLPQMGVHLSWAWKAIRIGTEPKIQQGKLGLN